MFYQDLYKLAILCDVFFLVLSYQFEISIKYMIGTEVSILVHACTVVQLPVYTQECFFIGFSLHTSSNMGDIVSKVFQGIKGFHSAC